jgi:choline dehydrogenase-like flavoprotein
MTKRPAKRRRTRSKSDASDAKNQAPRTQSNKQLDDIYLTRFDQAKGQYDFIIIGAGCYGTAFAHKVLESHPKATVLMIEKGGFLIPCHIQNLPKAYQPLLGRVGEIPWLARPKRTGFKEQMPYVGGRALFWNGWVPQPAQRHLREWPTSVVDELRSEWDEASKFVGRRPGIPIAGDPGHLQQELGRHLFERLKDVSCVEPYSDPSQLDAQMATGQPQALRGWSKFSPVDVLVGDIERYSGAATRRKRARTSRLTIVGHCEARKLVRNGDRVTAIETSRGTIKVGGASVVLALGAIESAALAKCSFPDVPRIGKNLGGHLRAIMGFRIPNVQRERRSDRLEIAAYYVAGHDAETARDLHVHVSAVHNPAGERQQDDLYRVLTDVFDKNALQAYADPSGLVVLLHCLAEWPGRRSERKAPEVAVERGRTVLRMPMTPDDEQFWGVMQRMMHDICDVIADGRTIEFLRYDKRGPRWSRTPLTAGEICQRELVHESGVLAMGENSAGSVTDANCRFHAVANLYATGGAVFPTCGSYNPTLLGIALAHRLARRLVARL